MSDDLDLMPPPISKAKKRTAAEPMLFSEFFDSLTEWFDGPSWRVWRVVGRVLFGEGPLTPDEVQTFTQFTGRTVPPTKRVREFWGIIGRRGGKGSFCSAVAVYLAFVNPPPIKRGVKGRIFVLAVDKAQASETLGYIKALIEMAGFTKQVKRITQEAIELKSGIVIEVMAADRKRIRGRTVIAAICDEVSSWWSEENAANPDREVLRALKPSMLGVQGAMLLGISSAFARFGTLYDAYATSYGVENSNVLVWKASTIEQRPTTDPDFLQTLADEKAADPVSYAAEYDSEFRQDVEAFVSIEDLDRLIVPGRVALPYDETAPAGFAFADMAGGMGGDSAALAIARNVDGLAVLTRLEEFRPPFNAVDVVRRMVAILDEEHCKSLTMDQYGGGTFPAVFHEFAPALAIHTSERKTSDNYVALIPLITGRRVVLLDHPRARSQVLSLERHVSQQGKEVITHPRRGNDDLACVLAGACVLASEASRHFTIPAWSYTKSYTDPQRAGTPLADGTSYLGNGTFRTARGELYRDARCE